MRLVKIIASLALLVGATRAEAAPYRLDAGIDFTRPPASSSAKSVTAVSNPTTIAARTAGGMLTGTARFARFNTSASRLTATVPEPVNWAMMLGGMGIIGMVMRSNKRRSSLFA